MANLPLMNRRALLKKATLCSPALLLPSCTSFADLALRQQFLIGTQQIRGNLLPFFPLQQQLQGVGQLSLSNPMIAMAPDINKVRIGLTTTAAAASGLGSLTGIPVLESISGHSTSGACQVACGLRYDPNTRGIFLKEPVIERLDLQNISPTLTEPFKALINTLAPKILDQRPIHTIEQSLASRFLNAFAIQENGIALKFS